MKLSIFISASINIADLVDVANMKTCLTLNSMIENWLTQRIQVKMNRTAVTIFIFRTTFEFMYMIHGNEKCYKGASDRTNIVQSDEKFANDFSFFCTLPLLPKIYARERNEIESVYRKKNEFFSRALKKKWKQNNKIERIWKALMHCIVVELRSIFIARKNLEWYLTGDWLTVKLLRATS